MKQKKYICKTCRCKTKELGHLCDPKTIAKNTLVYICAECGLITAERNLICKPKLLKLK